MRKRERLRKKEEGEEIVIEAVQSDGSVTKVFRFKKPSSTYTDWWLKLLDQRIEELEEKIQKLEDFIRKRLS